MAHNLARARALAPRSRVWAVVKADGYGHGLLRAAAGFMHADGLALLEFDGARRLREAGWRKPVLMIEGPFEPADVREAQALDLDLVVHRPAHLDWVAAADPARPLAIHAKFNSGMNRLGFDAHGLREAVVRLERSPTVRSVTLMTHFANADVPGGIDQALADFLAATEGLAGQRSVSNSAATIDHPRAAFDWVRPGVMLYGGTPFDDRDARSLGLRPAMQLRSELLAVQTLRAGDSVGYGSLFTASRPTRIGVVACGYADGYPRHAPVGTPVIVDGVRTGTAGRVAMDMLMVDLTPVPRAVAGSPVELWGESLPIDEVAQAAGTIGYELMCALAPRVAVIDAP